MFTALPYTLFVLSIIKMIIGVHYKLVYSLLIHAWMNVTIHKASQLKTLSSESIQNRVVFGFIFKYIIIVIRNDM